MPQCHAKFRHMDFFVSSPPEHIKREREKARELRRSNWWRQKLLAGACYYCQKTYLPGELTMDHKVPLARGGESTKSNVVCACKTCNNQKKYLTPVEMILSGQSLDQ